MSGYTKQDREWLKSHGICVMCKKRMTFNHYTICARCLEKNALRCAEYRERNKQACNARTRDWKERMKAEGRCTQCGKPNPDAGSRVRCRKCRATQNAWRMVHYVHKVKPDGECRYCQQPVVDGYRMCEHHLAQARRNLELARAKINRENHPWKAYSPIRRRDNAINNEKEVMT